ncbi:MAG: prephenate dehydratase [Actinobacteria bacterium]|nr:MAG: prephenate dehydratase [Actinomycetota bacterium]
MKIGYLGPKGSFSEEALLATLKYKEKELVPFPTIGDLITACDKGKVNKALVPVENSIEGSVNITLDTLVFNSSLVIEKEIVNNINHNLIAKKGTKIGDIQKVLSHPQASAQCQQFLTKNLPGVLIEAVNSTSEAVRLASEQDGHVAAIGTKLAAKLYGLKVLRTDIQDYKDNQTRFLLIGKSKSKRTGRDKTTIACFIYADKPGSLLQILQEFAYRNINLTKIQSRPTKKALGQYYFWIDMEGHISDELVADVIKCLKCKLREVKVLGFYPRK